jgi:hypothetical protein
LGDGGGLLGIGADGDEVDLIDAVIKGPTDSRCGLGGGLGLPGLGLGDAGAVDGDDELMLADFVVRVTANEQRCQQAAHGECVEVGHRCLLLSLDPASRRCERA